jgi:YHS domain-containing protein
MQHEHQLAPHDNVPTRPGATDPVCGMDVDRESVLTLEHDGTAYHFCSQRCRDRFQQDPSAYAQAVGGPGGIPPATSPVRGEVAEWTCPMHPEIRRPGPGSCPICGMALEPVTVTADAGPSPELADMTRRFWVATALTIPIVILEMGRHFVPWLHDLIPATASVWAQLLLATPVVLWAGWPFFVRGWASVRTRNLNMFTLIAMGTGIAWLFSLVATLAPGIFPTSFRSDDGTVDVYFEAAAVITTLVLLGQVLELRAREQTSGAIKACSTSAPRRPAASPTAATTKRSPWTPSNAATGSASARAKPSPSTGPSSMAVPPSMSPWSPASRCRSPRPPATPSSAAPSMAAAR